MSLLDEDSRFGPVFESMTGASGQQRPPAGVLSSWWDEDFGPGWSALRRLNEVGLIRVMNPDEPWASRVLHVPSPLWEAMRGERHERPLPGVVYAAPDALPSVSDLILPDTLKQDLVALP
jgi:hypothetical protein